MRTALNAVPLSTATPSRMSKPVWVSALILLSGLQVSTASASPTPAVPATQTAQTATQTTNRPTTAKPAATTASATRPMTAQQYIQQQYELRQEIKKMQQQVDLISQAHQRVMAQNQTLQMANDNLSVQVKVLQSEQSAQMFLYGAATIGIGGVMGFILGSVMARRQRRW